MRTRLFTIFFFTNAFVFSQQTVQYSQWIWNPLSYNPGLAGIKECPELKMQTRYQWAGFEGAPMSSLMTFSSQLASKRKKMYSPRHGIATKYEADRIGPFTANNLMVSYAAHFNYTQTSRLSVGISAGVGQSVFGNTNLTSIDPDPAIQKSNTYYTALANFGLWWNTDKYYLSFALEHLPKSKWKDVGFDSRYHVNYTFSGGFKWDKIKDWTIIPNILVKKTVASPISIDLNTYFDYQNQFRFGVGLRNKDSFIGLFQVNVHEKVAIGYSADVVISGINKQASFSHELSVNYYGCSSRDTGRLSCPLF
jgi:type IX secretion system PorP/SprF family membrane protein